VHLLRILAQHRVHGGADRPRSVTLEPVSRCHPSCTGRCTRFGKQPRIRNGNWQRLRTALPPAPAPHPKHVARICRTSRRQHRQPPKAMCVLAPCMRRYASTAQLGSRTSFTLPLVSQEPVHTARQQPALTTCNSGSVHHFCQVAAQEWPSAQQQPSPNFASNQTTAVRTTHASVGGRVPNSCAPQSRMPRTPNRGDRSTRTGSPSTLLHTQRRYSARVHNRSVVFRA